MKNLYLIAYDIRKNKKRKKIADLLSNYGNRINLSVFECFLTKKQLEQITEQLSEIINKKTDSVKIYFICSSCFAKSISLGKKEIINKTSRFL